MSGYLISSDSFVGHRQLEQTKANENEEKFFSHHRWSPEAEDLSLHQISNYQDRHRYHTMAIVGPIRVLGIVAHRGPVLRRFSRWGEYLSVDNRSDFFTTIARPANNFHVLVLLWPNCENSARQYNSTILFGRKGTVLLPHGRGKQYVSNDINYSPGRILIHTKDFRRRTRSLCRHTR